jgi:hypothetical protein
MEYEQLLNLTEQQKLLIKSRQKYFFDMGLLIFRLREARSDYEILIYNFITNKFSCYSIIRASEFLTCEYDIKFLYTALGNGGEIEEAKKENKDINDIYDDRSKKVLRSAIQLFIKNNAIIVDEVDFFPKKQLLLEEEGRILLNIFTPSQFMLKMEKEDFNIIKTPLDFPNIDKLIRHVCVYNDDLVDYFYKFHSFKLQNLYSKVPIAFVLHGERGIGKSKLHELIFAKIYGHMFYSGNSEDMKSSYNSHFLFGKLYIVFEEAIISDLRDEISEKFKNWIAEEKVSCSEKFKTSKSIHFLGLINLNSNNDKPIKIEENDRRWVVVGSQKQKIERQIISNLIKNNDEELKNFYIFLMQNKVDNILEIIDPYHTNAKTDISNSNYNSIQEFLSEAKVRGGFHVLADDNLPSALNYFYLKKEGKYFEAQPLYEVYQNFCKRTGYSIPFTKPKFMKELKNKGFEEKVIKNNADKSVRAIIIEEY